jgi:ABC-2 type transport system ATP-binding protein
MQNALELRGVTKRYANHLAVDDLTLSIPTGTIYGVLGPNGAGKSTTIRTAMNIVARDSGEVRLLGEDPSRHKEVLRRVGYLPEERGLYKKMRVLDVIEFFGRLKGMTRQDARRAGTEWLERMGLGEWRRSRVDQLSKGMQQKVQFITTVLHQPDLLILDEPGSGLDPVNQEALRSTILQARGEGRTVVLSTHNMKEAEELCDSVCIIADGRKVLDGTLREIRRESASTRWAVEYDDPEAGARGVLEGVACDGAVRSSARGWEVDLGPDRDPRELFAAVAALPTAPLRIARLEPTLHEIFVARVGGNATRPARRG